MAVPSYRIVVAFIVMFSASVVRAGAIHRVRLASVAPSSLRVHVIDPEKLPLPGVTVRLEPADPREDCVTDREGLCEFENLVPGWVTINVELDGFGKESRDVWVDSGVPAAVDVVLTPDLEQVIVLSCGRSCQDQSPSTVYELPRCEDFDEDLRLIGLLEGGDTRAGSLLRERYWTAISLSRRHEIGAALVGRVDEDQVFLDSLIEEASVLVSFPVSGETDGDFDPGYAAWCEARGVDPFDDYWSRIDALWHLTVATDPRTYPFLRRLVWDGNHDVLAIAVIGLILDDSNATTDVFRVVAAREVEFDDPAIGAVLQLRRDSVIDRELARRRDEDGTEDNFRLGEVLREQALEERNSRRVRSVR